MLEIVMLEIVMLEILVFAHHAVAPAECDKRCDGDHDGDHRHSVPYHEHAKVALHAHKPLGRAGAGGDDNGYERGNRWADLPRWVRLLRAG